MSIGVANILQSPEGVWSKGKPRLSCFGGVSGVTTFISVGSIPREWGPGELEFEALMRMLDNKVCMNTCTVAKPLRLFYIELSANKFLKLQMHNNYTFLVVHYLVMYVVSERRYNMYCHIPGLQHRLQVQRPQFTRTGYWKIRNLEKSGQGDKKKGARQIGTRKNNTTCK